MSVLVLNKENFDQEVLSAKGTVLVDFWASWCGPCRMLSPIIEEIAEEKKNIIKVGKVNVDEQPELASRFGVMSIPTLMVWKDGQLQNTSVGVKPKHMIEQML